MHIGAGKGTQAPRIRDEYCLCHLSTGDMLREAIKTGSQMGLKAKAIMDAGKLVGDDVVTGIVAEAIKQPPCKRGFILGYSIYPYLLYSSSLLFYLQMVSQELLIKLNCWMKCYKSKTFKLTKWSI